MEVLNPEVTYVNGSRIINLWQGFQDAGNSLLQWAQSQGHQVNRITVDTLPQGEALVVDRASVGELAELILESEALAGYLKTMPIVYVLRSDERLYPASLKFGFGSVAAVVVEGNREALLEALCPTQFSPLITQFVDLFGPPSGFGEKSTFEVDDFIDASPVIRKAIASCAACEARVMEQIHDLENRITLQTLLREQMLRQAIASMIDSISMETSFGGDQIASSDQDPSIAAMGSDERQAHVRTVLDANEGLEGHLDECGNCRSEVEAFLRGENPKSSSMIGVALMGKLGQLDDIVGGPIGNPFGGAGFQVIPIDGSDPELTIRVLEQAGIPSSLLGLIGQVISSSDEEDGAQPRG